MEEDNSKSDSNGKYLMFRGKPAQVRDGQADLLGDMKDK